MIAVRDLGASFFSIVAPHCLSTLQRPPTKVSLRSRRVCDSELIPARRWCTERLCGSLASVQPMTFQSIERRRKGRRLPFSGLFSSLDVSPSRSPLVTPACPLRVTRNPPAVHGDWSIQEETRDDYPRGSALVRGRGDEFPGGKEGFVRCNTDCITTPPTPRIIRVCLE